LEIRDRQPDASDRDAHAGGSLQIETRQKLPLGIRVFVANDFDDDVRRRDAIEAAEIDHKLGKQSHSIVVV
jgi:hypothetical protein